MHALERETTFQLFFSLLTRSRAIRVYARNFEFFKLLYLLGDLKIFISPFLEIFLQPLSAQLTFSSSRVI